MIYITSIAPAQFVQSEDGTYIGTILATAHQLGNAPYIIKSVHRNSDYSLENVILPYKVEANGDVKVFVDEPTLIRLTLMSDA